MSFPKLFLERKYWHIFSPSTVRFKVFFFFGKYQMIVLNAAGWISMLCLTFLEETLGNSHGDAH
jgi:hypothetical protein